MLPRIASIAAVLLWAPGIGVTVYGGKMLSPYELMALLLIPAIVLTSLSPGRLVFGLVSVAICTLSYVHSLDRATSGIYLVYYVLVIIPHMLLFVQIFEDDEAARSFLITFVKTGVWLGPLAVIQFLSPFQITLSNNTNYSLEPGLHRAHLFTPEASILAALYTIAICVAIYNSFTRIEPRMPGDSGSYLLMAAGLATTVSTSAFLVLPPLLLLIFRLCGVNWKKLLKYVVIGAVVLALFYLGEYQERVSSGGSASSSLLRGASMLGGVEMIFQHWATGLGLGMSKNVADAVKLIYFGWTHEAVEKPGIDSFQLALMAEMGVFPGIVSVIFAVICHRLLKGKLKAATSVAALVAIFSICVWFVSLVTSGYRGLAYCWMFFPAGYVVFLQTRRAAHQPGRDSTRSLVAGNA